MKKILILLLVSSVPLMSIAQKRSKKSKKEQSEKNSIESILVVKITELIKPLEYSFGESDITDIERNKLAASNESRVIVHYDFGNVNHNEVRSILETSREVKSVSEAVNLASKFGWKIISSTVVKNSQTSNNHYIYMKK